nr:MAG TPA: hypothetical protein [Caudoviricetes sp.]
MINNHIPQPLNQWVQGSSPCEDTTPKKIPISVV